MTTKREATHRPLIWDETWWDELHGVKGWFRQAGPHHVNRQERQDGFSVFDLCENVLFLETQTAEQDKCY
jgi:hypothetical protein